MSISQRDLKEFESQIKSLIEELEQALKSDQTDTVELDQARVGRLSRMDALQGQQMGLAQQRRKEQRILALQGALRRMENGDFGCCFVCGDEIERPRLEVDPAVTRCVECTE